MGVLELLPFAIYKRQEESGLRDPLKRLKPPTTSLDRTGITLTEGEGIGVCVNDVHEEGV